MAKAMGTGKLPLERAPLRNKNDVFLVVVSRVSHGFSSFLVVFSMVLMVFYVL